MKTSERGKALIKSFEHCSLDAYPDPLTGGRPWTIGWGHTQGVCQGDHITQELAVAYFEQDLAVFEALVLEHFDRPMTQGWFDALVSICYNVGPGHAGRDGVVRLRNGQPSTLRRKFLAGDLVGAAAEFDKWVSPGTAVERGLRRRRAAERALIDAESGDAMPEVRR